MHWSRCQSSELDLGHRWPGTLKICPKDSSTGLRTLSSKPSESHTDDRAQAPYQLQFSQSGQLGPGYPSHGHLFVCQRSPVWRDCMRVFLLSTPDSWSPSSDPLLYVKLAVHAHSKFMPCFTRSLTCNSRTVLLIRMHIMCANAWPLASSQHRVYWLSLLLKPFSQSSFGWPLVRVFFYFSGAVHVLQFGERANRDPWHPPSCIDLPIVPPGVRTSNTTAVEQCGLPRAEMVFRSARRGLHPTMLLLRQTNDSRVCSTPKAVRRAWVRWEIYRSSHLHHNLETDTQPGLERTRKD